MWLAGRHLMAGNFEKGPSGNCGATLSALLESLGAESPMGNLNARRYSEARRSTTCAVLYAYLSTFPVAPRIRTWTKETLIPPHWDVGVGTKVNYHFILRCHQHLRNKMLHDLRQHILIIHCWINRTLSCFHSLESSALRF